MIIISDREHIVHLRKLGYGAPFTGAAMLECSGAKSSQMVVMKGNLSHVMDSCPKYSMKPDMSNIFQVVYLIYTAGHQPSHASI